MQERCMKYGVRMVLPGVTEEQYSAMHAVLGPKGKVAPGAVLHMAGPTQGGWLITEVWETKEDQQRFTREEVMPITPADAPAPMIEEFEVFEVQVS